MSFGGTALSRLTGLSTSLPPPPPPPLGIRAEAKILVGTGAWAQTRVRENLKVGSCLTRPGALGLRRGCITRPELGWVGWAGPEAEPSGNRGQNRGRSLPLPSCKTKMLRPVTGSALVRYCDK